MGAWIPEESDYGPMRPPKTQFELEATIRIQKKTIAELDAELTELRNSRCRRIVTLEDQHAKLAEFVRWVFNEYLVEGSEESLEIAPKMERLGLVSSREYDEDKDGWLSWEYSEGDMLYFLQPWLEEKEEDQCT